MFKLKYYLIFILISINIEAQINSNISEFLISSLQNLSKNNQSESIYIQTSKDIYETSEDLWFKGYILNNQSLIPSLLSKSLYVQLTEDKTNKIVWEEKYSVDNGFVDGHIYIQDTLQSGIYRLSAYSKFSLLDSKKAIHSTRKLQIVKNITDYYSATKIDSTTTSKVLVKKEIQFQTFPEGGHLVSNIESRVAFKAVDKNGLPQKISGGLYENDKRILDIKSIHAGMGDFKFLPNHLKRYHIELDSFSDKKKYQLPKIKETGYGINLLNNTKDNLRFIVSRNLNNLEENVYLRIQVRGIVYGLAKINVGKKRIIKIPLKNLPEGISEVTLFDKDLNPVLERLVYVNQDKKLHIKTILDKGEYLTKEQVNLKIKVTDAENNPVRANIGLSVFDDFYKSSKNEKTIETHYQLSTQLKGNLYNPTYYFNKNNENRKLALDLLLLTQGWRNYIWNEDVLKKGPFKKEPIINTEVKGRLYTDKKEYYNILSKQYVLAFKADDKGTNLIEVDSIGNFTVPEKIIQKSVRAYLYLRLFISDSKYKDNIFITANNPGFSEINNYIKNKNFEYPIEKQKTSTKKTIQPFITSNYINKLDEVTVKAKKKKVFRDKYIGTLDSLARLGNLDYVCKNNILNCENHPGSKTKPVYGNTYLERKTNHGGEEKLQEIVYLRVKPYTEEELLKLYNIHRIKGYYPKKVFYEPIYDASEQINGFPDFRNTLLWKPNIITNEQGEASVSFYCSDTNAKFIGVLEGVSEDGFLGTESFEFFIRKRK